MNTEFAQRLERAERERERLERALRIERLAFRTIEIGLFAILLSVAL
jgi:uncharacterized membrane protein